MLGHFKDLIAGLVLGPVEVLTQWIQRALHAFAEVLHHLETFGMLNNAAHTGPNANISIVSTGVNAVA